MKIVFIGGTRFVGLEAVRQTAARGHEVWVLHRGVHSSPLPDKVQTIKVDRRDQENLRKTLQSLNPEVIIDTFAMTSEDAEISVNALTGLNARVVVLSSQDVYAQFGLLNGLPAPLPEETVNEKSPLTIPYPFRGITEHDGGESYDKKYVEKAFLQGIRDGALKTVTILRLPAIYGSGDYQRRFGAFIERLDSGTREILCEGGAYWRWTMSHVADAAHAIVLASEFEEKGFSVFNVGEEETPTMRDRAEQIAKMMGAAITWKETKDELPEAFALFGRAPTNFVVDSSLIRERLGFKEKISKEDAITDLINWSRKSLTLNRVP